MLFGSFGVITLWELLYVIFYVPKTRRIKENGPGIIWDVFEVPNLDLAPGKYEEGLKIW